jgi:hypothetical protein
MLAVLATLWLNLAAMVTLAGVGRGKLMGVTVAFAGALLILAAGVRPLAELRRTIRWLLGTGAAWLLIWGSLSLLLRAFLHGSQSGYSEALANHGPLLCACFWRQLRSRRVHGVNMPPLRARYILSTFQ